MYQLSKKTFTTSRNYTYTYYLHKSSSSTKPALVFCHGWPDDAHLWADIVPALLPLGFPLVIPDMLGYAGTSKPTDPKEYNSKSMSNDLYELVDSECFDKIIPVGHDWGSYMAQRVYLWRPERCVGLIILNVPYMPPDSSMPFNLDTVLDMTEKMYGYPSLAYWDVFAADDGPKLLLDNVENLYHLIHCNDESGPQDEAMKKVFCVRGATRNLLQTTKSQDVPLKPYARDPAFKKAFIDRMRRDGFEGPQCWYKAMARNVQFETEKEISKENLLIKNPCLYISSTGDAVCRTDRMEPVKQLVPDCTIKIVEANHWNTYEKPEEVREHIATWLKEKYM
ncbi:alpha/beta-hydrolase [Zopfia rhizophila CBS 207.26]|uniref:Alpha/beta-hydrolase n=1 Tax=Zopfia rhizophila CBS 207.26 TaxID=1314779 RepID=A0A6A6DX01_9PEZI|nr:alpha/beta-hydrolase [Zopfia rhizophila CBS 207.26]